MKSMVIVFGALLLIIGFPFFFTAIHDARTTDVSESFAGVASSNYTANITLSQSAFNNSINSITAISSNVSSDVPSASTYDTTSRKILVTGIAAGGVRTMTVYYEIASIHLPDGADVFLILVTWFYVFLILGFIGGAIYAFFHT